MIKYIDCVESIKDRETGAFIPKALDNRHYQQFLKWLDEGNTPVPAQPGPDHDLVDDTWVENADKKQARELAEAQVSLQKVDIIPLLITVVRSLIINDMLDLSPEEESLLTEIEGMAATVKAKRAK